MAEIIVQARQVALGSEALPDVISDLRDNKADASNTTLTGDTIVERIEFPDGSSLTSADGFGTGEANVLASVGTGVPLNAGKSGESLLVKSLIAGTGVSLTSTGTAVVITAESSGGGGGEANTISSIGTGSAISAGKVGVDLRVKSLAAGSGVTITDSGSTLTVNATGGGGGGGEANTLSSVGAGVPLSTTKVGVDLRIKSLVAGTNVTLTPDGNTVTIAAAGGGGGGGDAYLAATQTFTGENTFNALTKLNSQVRVNATSWASTNDPVNFHTAGIIAKSSNGHAGVFGVALSSENPLTGSMGSIGVAGYAESTNSNFSYGLYGEARIKPGGHWAQAGEFNIINSKGAPADFTANSGIPAINGSAGLWVSSGRPDTTNFDSTVGLALIYNGARFRRGIVIQQDALTSLVGSAFVAMQVGFDHRLTFGDDNHYITQTAAGATIISNGTKNFTIDNTACTYDVFNSTGVIEVVSSASSGVIRIPNGKYYSAKDTSGNNRAVLGIDGANWTSLLGGPNGVYMADSSNIPKVLAASSGTNPVSLYVNGVLKVVTQGPANSGGTGYAYLRVLN